MFKPGGEVCGALFCDRCFGLRVSFFRVSFF